MEMNTSWKLTISMSPIMLNTFHVPLVDYYDNFFFFTIVNFFKKIFISLINKYSFELIEKYIHWLNIPINLVSVQTFFWKLRWFWIMNSRNKILSFQIPELVSRILQSFIYICCKIYSFFMIKSLPGYLIKFLS
jgi:hypothetical protein